MTTQKLANYSRKFMGWFYVLFGILDIAVGSYLCAEDHRTTLWVTFAMQMPAALFVLWVGAKRIYESKRAA
jgi:hypothetical protein